MTLTTITVGKTDPYDVTVGPGASAKLAQVLGERTAKVLIVHPPVMAARAAALRETLGSKYEVLLAETPDAEDAKRIEVAAFCWQILGQTEFTRTDAVIGLGGGATTDLAGFVAANWLRGVRWIAVPTSVAGMVDAAVGGKTAVNTAEGKNLVGAFHSPVAVLADLDFLETLPKNEVIAGFAEVIKCGFIGETEILDIVESDPELAIDVHSSQFRRCVELAIGLKARVVGEDFRESGLREILNYGHTLGHAIEHQERYRWRHGAAISVGMVYAAELGHLAGSLSEAAVDRHRRVLSSVGLPLEYRGNRWQGLLGIMRRDKKARGGMLRFIVLDKVGHPRALEVPDESLLFAAYQAIVDG